MDAHQPTQPTYQLTTNNCIAVLEAELFNLGARRAPQVQYNRMHAQKARNANRDNDNKEAVTAARAQQYSGIEEVPDKDTTQPLKETPSAPTQPANIPEHPFWLAKDTTYSPPVTKNIGAQDKPITPTNKRPEPAYKTLPPIHDLLITEDVYKRSMETPITITQWELLSVTTYEQ